MPMAVPTVAPMNLSALSQDQASLKDPELAAFVKLHQAGLAIAPLRVVPAGSEERFYQLNNLPTRLNELFADLDPTDPDEDEVEELFPDAQTLVKNHYLLDEFIDLFYRSLEGLPGRVRVRRPSVWPGRSATRGRPALIALKQLWADDWSFEALTARLQARRQFSLEARPVIVQAAGDEVAEAALQERASQLLGRPLELRVEPGGGITQVAFL